MQVALSIHTLPWYLKASLHERPTSIVVRQCAQPTAASFSHGSTHSTRDTMPQGISMLPLSIGGRGSDLLALSNDCRPHTLAGGDVRRQRTRGLAHLRQATSAAAATPTKISLGSCPSRNSTAAVANLCRGVPTATWRSAMKVAAAPPGPRRQQRDLRWRLGRGFRRRSE